MGHRVPNAASRLVSADAVAKCTTAQQRVAMIPGERSTWAARSRATARRADWLVVSETNCRRLAVGRAASCTPTHARNDAEQCAWTQAASRRRLCRSRTPEVRLGDLNLESEHFKAHC
jgi:hypothetical protein